MIDGWIHAFLCNLFQWENGKKINQESDLETPFLLQKRSIHMSCFVIDIDPARYFTNLTTVFFINCEDDKEFKEILLIVLYFGKQL